MKPKLAKWIEIDRQTGEQIGRPTFKWNPGKDVQVDSCYA